MTPQKPLTFYIAALNPMNEHSFQERAVNIPESLAPLVPASAATDRGAEILASIRSAFAEKGFDGASMQDLARAAGMSVGNFYRYFPSKAAIVEALIGLDLAEMEADFLAVLQSPTPMDSLRALMQQRLQDHRTRDDGQLWRGVRTGAAFRAGHPGQQGLALPHAADTV